MAKIDLVTCFVLCAAGAARSQPAAERIEFEVASVKASVPGKTAAMSFGGKAEVEMQNQPLKRLIERAYGVFAFQVVAPDWTNNERFDIVAKYSPDTKPQAQALMLRSLL